MTPPPLRATSPYCRPAHAVQSALVEVP